jgi:hypothetical protein
MGGMRLIIKGIRKDDELSKRKPAKKITTHTTEGMSSTPDVQMCRLRGSRKRGDGGGGSHVAV